MSSAHLFLDGVMLAMFLVIALFQLRFWRNSRDRIFLFFAIAFLVLAANRVALALVQASETQTYLYVVRLVAFCIILFAIFDKNKRSKSESILVAPTSSTAQPG
jgi:hypothetical protein